MHNGQTKIDKRFISAKNGKWGIRATTSSDGFFLCFPSYFQQPETLNDVYETSPKDLNNELHSSQIDL